MLAVKKVPVYKEKDGVFVKVGEVSEEEAKSYVDEPDVEEVTGIYIIEDKDYLLEEEGKVHEYKIP